ncbi:competence pheromone ComX [Metabacillus sediminilitoris]|jgi:competence protein ComX|uniref:ComX pheromone n=1 Tax=Metabacillus sediminilitoris TaxID=2567941 RepID=A0A4S4C0E8_9BACI|nr:competence pheromone ComX [Metabacillus sediminilitoris]QGQ47841.1 competence pheromone ComX [Metabacillus sediminilitoris]THF81046.1 competence pheromone ComX [Metabacillus sediminilitoris]
MQEIVNFLIENPDVLEKVVNGQASLLGVELDDVLGVIEGILGSASLKNFYWI